MNRLTYLEEYVAVGAARKPSAKFREYEFGGDDSSSVLARETALA
jgi:hypothetical protein